MLNNEMKTSNQARAKYCNSYRHYFWMFAALVRLEVVGQQISSEQQTLFFFNCDLINTMWGMWGFHHQV